MRVKAATRTLLTSAVALEVSAAPIPVNATSVDVKVKVTNLSGHKFPTGYADGRERSSKSKSATQPVVRWVSSGSTMPPLRRSSTLRAARVGDRASRARRRRSESRMAHREK